MEELKYIKNAASGELTEKKSRFIATMVPVGSEEEAAAFIASMKKKYYDARHNCYAYIIGDISKASDDGEPAHTAGRPMLDILTKEGLDGICVVVTRYFGGVLLGTGGLVRAYQGAVRETINNAQIYTRRLCFGLHIICDYNDHGKLSHLAESRTYSLENTEYSDKVAFDLYIPPADRDECIKTISRLTDGRADLHELGELYK